MPGIFLADGAAASAADRCHSLSSLAPPPAALASLPLLACQENRFAAFSYILLTASYIVFDSYICSASYIACGQLGEYNITFCVSRKYNEIRQDFI